MGRDHGALKVLGMRGPGTECGQEAGRREIIGVDMVGFGGLWRRNMRGKNTAFLTIPTPQEMKAGGWEMQNIGGGSKHDVNDYPSYIEGMGLGGAFCGG